MMNKITEYLNNNPEYYINGGEEIITNLNNIKDYIDLILKNDDKITFSNDYFISNEKGYSIINDDLSGRNIGHINYANIRGNWYILGSGLSDRNNKNKGYGKNLYIKTALDALNNNKILISDTRRALSNEAKYLWNSFVNFGLVEFDENLNRFKFINNMLEDYFPEQIKNSD